MPCKWLLANFDCFHLFVIIYLHNQLISIIRIACNCLFFSHRGASVCVCVPCLCICVWNVFLFIRVCGKQGAAVQLLCLSHTYFYYICGFSFVYVRRRLFVCATAHSRRCISERACTNSVDEKKAQCEQKHITWKYIL